MNLGLSSADERYIPEIRTEKSKRIKRVIRPEKGLTPQEAYKNGLCQGIHPNEYLQEYKKSGQT